MKTMTQEEILEYNKLCAEFLKWEFTTFKEVYNHINDFKGNQYDSLEELQFHSDWNWIMMVIEKIEGLGFNTDSYSPIQGSVELEYTLHEFNIWDKINPEIQGRGKTKKEAVIQAINQFLIWYNEQNK